MKTIRYIGAALLISAALQSWGQEQFTISQYYQVQSILNPGFTGIDDFLDIKVGYKRKWAGLDNSPSTSFVSAFGSIGDKTSYNQSPIRTSNPNQIEYIESQRAKVRFHGIGGYIAKQEQGAFSQVNIMVNYAYHIPVNPKIRVSLGTSFGFSNIRIDPSKISVWDQVNDPIYQAYINGDGNYSRFLISLGGVVYGKKSYVGLSYLPVVDVPLTNNIEDLATDDKITLMVGTKFAIAPSMTLLPSVLVEANIVGKSRIVGNLLLDIKSMVKTGFSFSSANDLGFIVMFTYKNDYGLGYAYETSLGNETTIGNGTHEIILSFNLFNHLNSAPRLW
jgi:type IX secretion system PorP/SprF family membrane protein